MSILSKAPALAPGQTINLSKMQQGPKVFYFGGKWGAIQTAGVFGLGKKFKKVDLDICSFAYDADGKLISECSYRYPVGSRGFHFAKEMKGDDRGGSTDRVDDGLDNETIAVDTSAIPGFVTDIMFVINSYSKQPFDELPFAGVRIYEGSVDCPTVEHCTFSLANDGALVGKKTMIVGSLFRNATGGWDFKSCGETRAYHGIKDFIREVERSL